MHMAQQQQQDARKMHNPNTRIRDAADNPEWNAASTVTPCQAKARPFTRVINAYPEKASPSGSSGFSLRKYDLRVWPTSIAFDAMFPVFAL